MWNPKGNIQTLLIVLVLCFGGIPFANAHCDTEDGPVIADAKAALENGNVAPVLKWVKKESEKELGNAFNRTLAVRGKGEEARALADRYFFETLVRLHRAGEGEPFTGIKPAGSVEPVVLLGDRAIERGSIAEVAHEISEAVVRGMKERFARVTKLRGHRNDSVQAGREYVAAYVDFMHYLEAVHLLAEKGVAGHVDTAVHTHGH